MTSTIDGAKKAYIQDELERLEHSQEVRVLYAVESGSRAWGFPSRDSDYDVRFIYLHPTDWYLSVEGRRDVIEHALEPDLDLSGWDLPKALALFRKSNPPLLEWLHSPIVYKEDRRFTERLRALLPDYYSPRACMYHYLHMAGGNMREYLKGERVWTKKYFYVLRPLLACKWIEAGRGVAPMAFPVLVEAMVEDDALKEAIGELLERKRKGEELDEGPRVEVISSFIEHEVARLNAKLADVARGDLSFEPLNELFKRTLREVWES